MQDTLLEQAAIDYVKKLHKQTAPDMSLERFAALIFQSAEHSSQLRGTILRGIMDEHKASGGLTAEVFDDGGEPKNQVFGNMFGFLKGARYEQLAVIMKGVETPEVPHTTITRLLPEGVFRKVGLSCLSQIWSFPWLALA